MLNYRFLNLPTQPLKDENRFVNENIMGYSTYDAVDILSDEVLDIFNSNNLKPTFCAVFSKNNFTVDFKGNNSVIHADISRVGINDWKPIVCGVNWELNNNENKFYWVDVGTLTKHYPLVNSEGYIQKQQHFDRLAGTSYGPQRRMNGFIEGTKIIEEVELTQPTLVRTDIPHLVTYNSPNKIRFSLSVRFDETWSNWNEAVTAFTPFIK